MLRRRTAHRLHRNHSLKEDHAEISQGRHLRVSPDTRMMGVMPDTITAERGVTNDTPRYRLTREAAERARTRLGLRRLDNLATHLGISRRSFFRLLEGTYPISLNRAATLAEEIGWPLGRVFERCDP